MDDIIKYKEQIYAFLSEFGQVYDENQVPANNQDLNPNQMVNFPYITYNELGEDWTNDGLLQVYIYDRSDNMKSVYNIGNEISKKVQEGCLFNDIIVHKGSPLWQPLAQDEITIKCLFMNLQINYV